MVAFLLHASGAAAAPLGESRDDETWRILTRGAMAERAELMERLVHEGRSDESFRVLLDVIPVLSRSLDRAVTRRDSQGKRLFRHFERNYKPVVGGARWITLGASGRYKKLLQESRRLNEAVREAAIWLERCQRAGRLLAARCRPVDDDLMAAVTEGLERSTNGRERARLLACLDGDLVRGFRSHLGAFLAPDRERVERLAALQCASRGPDPTWIETLQSVVEDPDPFLRRAAYEVLAALGSVAAIDLLVLRMGEEIGVPRTEVRDHLIALTGENLGSLPVRWREWWTGAREEWKGPAKRPGADESPPEGWRYYGLRLDSRRVIFVLDVSGSMSRRVDYAPSSGYLRELGRRKIEIAREELAKAVTAFDEETTFNIVAYNQDVERFSRRMESADSARRAKARQWVAELEPGRGTNAFDALKEALSMTVPGARVRDEEIADTILFLSDGEPTCGTIPDREDILAEVARLNPQRRVRIHCIHLGNEKGAEFMERLAAENGGQFIHVK